jgi:hypothetical protein
MIVKAVVDEVKFQLVRYLICNVYDVRTNRPDESITKNNKLMDTEERLLLARLGHFKATFMFVTQKDFQSTDDLGGLVKGAYYLGRLSNDCDFESLSGHGYICVLCCVIMCSKSLSDRSSLHARSPSKHAKGFILVLAEANSELERIGQNNPVQQKDKNKMSNGVSESRSGTTKRLVTGERTSFDGQEMLCR